MGHNLQAILRQGKAFGKLGGAAAEIPVDELRGQTEVRSARRTSHGTVRRNMIERKATRNCREGYANCMKSDKNEPLLASILSIFMIAIRTTSVSPVGRNRTK